MSDSTLFQEAALNKGFNDAFDTLLIKGDTIKFNPKWANGTGYFNSATSDESITKPGCATDFQGRRIVLIPTKYGNAVFFDRYSNEPGKPVIAQIPTDVAISSFPLRSSRSYEWDLTENDLSGVTAVGQDRMRRHVKIIQAALTKLLELTA